MELIVVRHSNQLRQPNGMKCGAAFKSIAPAKWNEVQRGIQINCAGQMGLIAAWHSNQSRRPNRFYCGAEFTSIVLAK
jgi:hypothetical protein